MPNIDLSKCWINSAPPSGTPDTADIETYGSLVAFQRLVCSFLSAWLPLAPVASQTKPGAITYADKKTVESDTQNALRSIGISIVVGLDSGVRSASLRNAVTFDPFTFVVTIAESPVTNRGASGTGITASRCAELVMLCLSGASLGNGCCSVKSFSTNGELGSLQTAEVTFQTAYAIIPPASLLESN